MRFFDFILGILIAEPTKLLPVMKMPLYTIKRVINIYHAAPMIEKPKAIATPM
jgi:hypothetical protein